MDQVSALRELWSMFRRRFPILLVIGALGAACSAFIAYILPPVYQSQARILVESQQIPTELARSTVTASASERLQLIQQRLMTRDNLLRLIDDLGLFADRPDLTLSEKIGLIRQATEIKPVELVVDRRRRRFSAGQISAFTITITFNNAAEAAKIANEFVTTVLDQNLRARTERASETLTFFEQEEERISGALNSLEVDITTYKGENELALPENLEFNRNEVARLATTDLEIDRKLLELEEESAGLESTLKQLEASNGSSSERQSPEEQQLRQLQNMMVQKRAVFAEGHREIRALKAQIAALEASLPKVVNEDGETTDIRDLQKANIQRQRDLLGTQITLLRDQKAQLQERTLQLQSSIQQTPNVEMTLGSYFRQREDLQTQLANVVKKRAEAQTGERLEINQQAERFEVIENALVADNPISPNRKKIVAFGSAASLGLAAAIAFLLELLNP
ncbi:MAG: Wzz/FepE/Etk N-terminal domain-containing protein, partial [Pseudomonadota bacterium]